MVRDNISFTNAEHWEWEVARTAKERVVLRNAVPADSEFAYSVKKAAFREYAEKVWGWDENQQRCLHDQRFDAQDFRIVSVAGTDVGVMAVVTTAEAVELNQIFILPEHQGKGIGRKCVLHVIEEARQLDVPVRLQVMKANPRAKSFYERLGGDDSLFEDQEQ